MGVVGIDGGRSALDCAATPAASPLPRRVLTDAAAIARPGGGRAGGDRGLPPPAAGRPGGGRGPTARANPAQVAAVRRDPTLRAVRDHPQARGTPTPRPLGTAPPTLLRRMPGPLRASSAPQPALAA